jgi:hypothetical protein
MTNEEGLKQASIKAYIIKRRIVLNFKHLPILGCCHRLQVGLMTQDIFFMNIDAL